MKKALLLTSCFLFTLMLAKAQLTVFPAGNVGMCSTSFTPYSAYTLYIQNTSISDWASGCHADGPAVGNGYTATGLAGQDTTGYVGSFGGYAYGVYGQSYRWSAVSYGRHYGVYGIAGNASAGYNYGVYGALSGSKYGAGVFGTTGGDYSIPGNYAGFFNGAIYMTSDYAYKTTTNTWYVSSDKRLKKSIVSFTDGLNVIRKINPVTFQFTGAGGLPTTDTNIGVLAQDVQKVAKYCIKTNKLIMKQADASAAGFTSNDIISSYTDTTGTSMVMVNSLTMNTHGLFYAMINSIKQLDSTVTALQQQLNQCCNANTRHALKDSNTGAGKTTDTTITQIELSNNTDIVLYQNQPNPFTGSTVIRYFIPQTVSGNVYISFSDTYGVEIKRVPITVMGFGNIDAGTQNLVSGVYTYSLVVNGIVIDTKKMIKTQ